MPGRYFLVFLTFSAFRNSFHGALPPTIGRSFLWAGSPPMQMALPQQPSGPIVGSATTMVTYPLPPAYSPPQPASSSPPAPAPPPSGEELLAGEGWCTGEGGYFSTTFSFFARLASHLCLLTVSSLSSPSLLASLARQARSPLVLNTVLPSLSFLGACLVLAMLFEIEERKL